MKKHVRHVIVLLAFVMSLVLVACAGGGTGAAAPVTAPAPPAAAGAAETLEVEVGDLAAAEASLYGFTRQNPFIWKIGHNNAEDHYWNIFMTSWGDMVYEATGGKIVFELYPSAQLGDDSALGEMIRNGNIEMMITGSAIPGRWYRPMLIMQLPTLFDSIEHVVDAANGELGDVIARNLAEQNILYFGAWARTPWAFLTTFEVNEVSDLTDRRMRTMPDEGTVALMSAIYNLNATPIAFAEVFTSLQQGVVEGLNNPISSLYTMRFHEVATNLSVTGTHNDFAAILVSPQQWEALGQDLRDVMNETFEMITPLVTEYILTEDELFISHMQETMPSLRVVHLDTEEIWERTTAIQQDIIDLLDAQEFFDAARASSPTP